MPPRVLVPSHIAPDIPPMGWGVHRLSGLSMGTSWSVSLAAPRQRDLDALQRRIQAWLDEIVAQMSHWDDTSALGRFNQSEAGSRHSLPPLFQHVLRYGLEVARDSGGAFDPTAGALVNAWGFGPGSGYRDEAFTPPIASHLEQVRAQAGWHLLPFDQAEASIVQPGGLMLDLSSIAKGFAVDHVTRSLKTDGIAHCLVEVGGELRGEGMKPDGQPWWVSLEQAVDDPDAGADMQPQGSDLLLALHGLSVATSGDYRRYVMHEGQRLSHTLDPRTGAPVTHGLCSVSVLHTDCMAADALSTALLVMGHADGLAWATARGLIARFVQRTHEGWREHLTPAMQVLMASDAPQP